MGAENEIKLSDTVVTLAYVLIAAGELFLFSCLLIVVLFYDTRIMRFSQRQGLIGMVLLGMVAVGGLVLLPDISDSACQARLWVVGLPLFSMFNLLLGKTWRIWKVVVSSTFKKVSVRQTHVSTLINKQ